MSKASPSQAKNKLIKRQAARSCNNRAPVILFTCIGRRVSLLNAFRQAARQLRIHMQVLGTDVTEWSPALRLCDRSFLVKPTDHPGYIKQLMSIVKTHHIDLIIPTVDLDLKILSKSQTSLQAMDCRVLISAPPVVDICRDKRKTYRFLVKHGFNTPITASVHSVLTGKVNISAWPLLIKPWDGSAGRDHRIARNRQELQFFSKRIRHPVCQQWIQGKEYTCDVYVDRHMKVRCVVPRRRMEVRAGEVSKARIEKNPSMIDGVTRLVQTLKAGPGVITVQLIVTNRKELMFIEINPRFGGGVPLSIQAGAHFPKWVLRELLGRPLKIQQEGFQDGLVMLRYDSEVWIQP